MAPGKRRQSNAALYTLIFVIVLLVASTTVAVVYYVEAEKHRAAAEEAANSMKKFISQDEQNRLGSIIGAEVTGESRLGQMTGYMDALYRSFMGGPLPSEPAENKAKIAAAKVAEIVERAKGQVELQTYDPNLTGLVSVVDLIQAKLDVMTEERNKAQQELADYRTRFDNAIKEIQQQEQKLLADANQITAQVAQIKKDFDTIREQVEQAAKDKEENLAKNLDDTRGKMNQLNQDLVRTQAELQVAQDRMKAAIEKVNDIQPPPDRETLALKPDGKIILVDDSAGVVQLNVGSEDRVYQGLTFAVYDKAGAIPKDGKAKAEVEVFYVDKRVCAARIVKSDKTNPIATGDLIANLIWDKSRTNHFVIAGDFDLDRNGTIDFYGPERIKALIEKWSGVVGNAVSAETDFVILGNAPTIPPQPTAEDLANDPTARDKYDAATERLNRYNEIQKQAQALWIPIFTYERFLNFTGYVGQIGKPGVL